MMGPRNKLTSHERLMLLLTVATLAAAAYLAWSVNDLRASIVQAADAISEGRR